MNKQILLYFYLLVLLFDATETIEAVTPDIPDFIHDDKNVIVDEQHSLSEFYEQLYLLELSRKAGNKQKEQPCKVSVMHIGDSHIQAGFFSVEMMNLLQERFGSAGRGLIFPLKLAKTNEPFDYLIRSQEQWDRTLCVQRVKKLPVGLGGLAIKATDSSFTFEIQANSKTNDHSFNTVTVFHHAKAPGLYVADKDVRSYVEATTYPFISRIHLDKAVSQLNLSSETTERQDSAIYYGFSLENGKSGILYHAVGMNGAQFRHYASVQDFAEQISVLTPSLLIFSLGTNESFRGKLIEERFFGEIDRIIQPILKENPKAKVLITTPPDCLESPARFTQKSNPNLREVREALIRYARKNNFAYWDLYSVLGGDDSAYPLYRKGYLSEDGVHFKKGGYTLLGHLFYDALLNDFTSYVQHRYK